ncbi:MAG: GAF domain-containing protein [Pseudomonadota bacterium]
MARTAQQEAKLKELADFQPHGALEDTYYRLTCILGDLLGVRRVSLMLLDTGPGGETRLRLAAVYGELPEAAWKEETRLGQGIAGQVLAQGHSLRVADLAASKWKTLARRQGDSGPFMACGVPIGSAPAGVLNFSDPVGTGPFSPADQRLAELAASLTGRAIQLARVDRLLDSRLAQMAFALEGAQDACSVVSLSAHEPEKVAGLLARAFYKEMRHCGFTPNQVIHAAGEILSELTRSLNRHKHRANDLSGEGP